MKDSISRKKNIKKPLKNKAMTTEKKHKVKTPNYYFTYSNRQNSFYKEQTDKIASLYRVSDGQLVSELNTEADKVNGISKFTHKETIDWFDSILNPVKNIPSGIELISKERVKQISKHGFTGAHHFNHPEWYEENQLIYAGQILLSKNIDSDRIKKHNLFPKNWDKEWFHNLCNRSYQERLIIAGALIAAEIDRLCFINKK
jgi:hypothetical protein